MKNRFFIFSSPACWLLLLLAPLPFIFFLAQFVVNIQQINSIEKDIDRLQVKSVYIEEAERKENVLLASLKNPDAHYVDKHLETLNFLVPEIKKLEALQSENPDEEQIVKRLQFLKEGSNRLFFAEDQIRTNKLFQEIEEQQQHPIELNEEDLRKLLCLIEGVMIWPYGPKEGRPQLIIKEFRLSKKELLHKEKVFVVSMQLIKRENVESLK